MGLLRGLLFDNLGLKLVALLLAVLVYLHVYTERPFTMVLSFPLELTDLADTLAVSGPLPEAVHAELRGTGKSLIRLRLTEPRIKVSLANAEPGPFERTLTVDDLPLMATDRLEVTRLAGPTDLTLRIDPRVVRRVPVAARVDADLPAGVTISGKPSLSPATLAVRGPSSVVDGLDSLRLRTVRVDGRHDTVRVDSQLAEVPEWTTVDQELVRVTVSFARPAATPR